MADRKLSALTELAATPADNDEVYIRDVSEAAAQESKRITIANLKAALTGSEIKTLYEVIANAYTDIKNAKLAGIDTGAKDDQTGNEIVTLLEALIGAAQLSHTKVSDIGSSDHHVKYLDAEAVAAVEAAGLVLAAAKKIIIANDGVIQLGTLTGAPNIFGGVAGEPFEVWIQPKEGNNKGELGIRPKGTQDETLISLWNSSDYANAGYFQLGVNSTLAYLVGQSKGTGSTPTELGIGLLVRPYTNEGYSLGKAAYRWLESWVMHRQLAHPLPVDHTWAGNVAEMTAGTALTIGQACYVGGDGKLEKALATGAGTMPAMALATATISENASGQFLLQGFFRDDTWNWTPGGFLYVSKDTAGALTQTLPAASGEQVQIVGVAMTADIIHFNPSYELVEIS